MENGPQNLTILDGKDATLTCNAVAAPIPNTTWIYNGISLTNEDTFSIWKIN